MAFIRVGFGGKPMLDVRRREFIVLVVALLMLAVPAAPQQQRVWRVGYLTLSAGSDWTIRGVTLATLAEHGFVEGRNLELIERMAAGDPDRLLRLAREIAAARPDVIIAVSRPAIQAAMQAAPQTPIVMSFAGGDPVVAGFATSLARPGGKVTGIVMLADEANLKRLELLHDVFPSGRRIGVQMGSTSAFSSDIEQRLQSAAAVFGVDLIIRKVGGPQEIESTIAALRSAGAQAILLASDPLFANEAGSKIAALAIRERLPLICDWKDMAHQGCLLSFGPDRVRLRRRTGEFVVRILEGTDPATLPIERADRFELAVNLRTARMLGIELPLSILGRADEVIE
jgi:ABC-type uncharacterized transport system substrate-binding protein